MTVRSGPAAAAKQKTPLSATAHTSAEDWMIWRGIDDAAPAFPRVTVSL